VTQCGGSLTPFRRMSATKQEKLEDQARSDYRDDQEGFIGSQGDDDDGVVEKADDEGHRDQAGGDSGGPVPAVCEG
jgi:hypothetical protein